MSNLKFPHIHLDYIDFEDPLVAREHIYPTEKESTEMECRSVPKVLELSRRVSGECSSAGRTLKVRLKEEDEQ